MVAGMTMSKHAFQAIEGAFGLHPATLPSFLYHRGTMSYFTNREPGTGAVRRLQLVVKACQKVEVANYLLSLSFDVATGWTHAFICGYGVLRARQVDNEYGFQLDQLRDAITASPEAWCNPLFLPFILLHNYTQRIEVAADFIDMATIKLEFKLGATQFAKARLDMNREKWLRSIDPQEATIELHSMLPQANFLAGSCKWLLSYADFLLKIEDQLSANIAFQQQVPVFAEIRSNVSLLRTVIVGEGIHFATLWDRLSLQTNLLYSVVAQQDNFLNRWDSRLNQIIARSAKRDSISMTTFTFIAALFLPGTFVATLFSMTMFDWTGVSSNSTSDSSMPYVSNLFWLFWVIAVPLTIITVSELY